MLLRMGMASIQVVVGVMATNLRSVTGMSTTSLARAWTRADYLREAADQISWNGRKVDQAIRASMKALGCDLYRGTNPGFDPA